MLRQFVIAVVLTTGLSFGVSVCHAQSAVLDLPRPSQHSAVSQRIGITDITISYHRPLVKGRTIWGKVVPTTRSGAQARTRTPPSLSPTLSRSKGSR